MGNQRLTTVRQLLASPALTGAEVVAGEAGLDEEVTEVVLHGRLRSDAPPQPGEAVVLDAAGIGEHLYQIDVAIRIVADAGSSTLIVTNPGFELDVGVRRLANRFDVPLAVVPDTDAMTLAHRLRAQLWAADVEHASAVDSLLVSLSRTHAASVDLVLGAVAELSASSVCLLGQDRSLVAGDAIEIGDRRLASGPAYLVDNSAEAALHSTAIVLTPGEAGEDADYWLVAETRGSDGVQRLLRSLLQIGSWYLAALLASVRARSESDARRRIAVLNELLATSDLHERDIRNQMLALGWSAAGWNTGLHITLHGADTSRIIDLHAEVRERLRGAGLDGPLVERNDGWSGWVTESSEPAVENYSAMVRRLSDALAEFVDAHSDLRAHAGIGRPYADLAGLRLSLTEAHEAALIANARFGGRSRRGPHRPARRAAGADGLVRVRGLRPLCPLHLAAGPRGRQRQRTAANARGVPRLQLLHHRGRARAGPAPQHGRQPDPAHSRTAGRRSGRRRDPSVPATGLPNASHQPPASPSYAERTAIGCHVGIQPKSAAGFASYGAVSSA